MKTFRSSIGQIEVDVGIVEAAVSSPRNSKKIRAKPQISVSKRKDQKKGADIFLLFFFHHRDAARRVSGEATERRWES